MHFLVAWEPNEHDRSQVALRIIESLSGYKFAKTTDNAYVVGVDSEAEYNDVRDKLIETGKADSLNIIITPPISGGTYVGLLPSIRWSSVNKISTGASGV